MKIAVINTGSSSLKFKLFDMDTDEVIYSLLVENIASKGSKIKTYHDALEVIDVDFSTIDAIGHRVVHGAEEFCKPVIIDTEVMKKIEKLIPLAPLHNKANLEGIKVAFKKAPSALQVAVFDTAFHSTMPKEAFLYALPIEMYEQNRIRRYGFHGSSHSYLLKECAKILQKEPSEINIITLHLGAGASVCAIKEGKSIDTSMGFTPLEGLVMASRCGDIDPAIVLYIQRELGFTLDEVDEILNKKSGLKGICHMGDLRQIITSKDEKSSLCIDMMVRRIQKYIGAYSVLLQKVDALVFSGGIGENSEYIRNRVTDNEFIKNIKTIVIKTDEELEIAREVFKIVK